jgi:hypothetical protein
MSWGYSAGKRQQLVFSSYFGVVNTVLHKLQTNLYFGKWLVVSNGNIASVATLVLGKWPSLNGCNSHNSSVLENLCQSYSVLGSKYENIVYRLSADSPTIFLSYLFLCHSFYAGLRDMQSRSKIGSDLRWRYTLKKN